MRLARTTASLTLAFTFIASTAIAAPKWLRLSYTGDTSTTMTVAWNTDAAEATEVRYGTNQANLDKTATGTSFVANGSLGHVHETTLTELEPNTTYYYVAGSSSGGFSAPQAFKTGPSQHEACGKFRFVFLGDNRPDPTFGGGENWPEILGQSAVHQPSFVVNGGDLVIDGPEIEEWKDFLGWTETVASTTPFMPCIGNHDNGPGEGDGANYNQLFALPRSTGPNGSGTEDYYFFTFANAIFVSLSTESFTGGTPKFATQAAWLDEVLTNNPRKWKFVNYHKPTYTHEAFFSISHESNEAGQNEAFVTVIDKHHVDVVFTSHNHWYERFHPSACGNQGNPGSGTACSVGPTAFDQGTVYYVSGGAGAFTIPGFLCGSEDGRAKCSGDHHYIVADIQDEVLKLDTWGAFPQSNQVIDTVTITKPADSCTTPPDAGVDAGDSGPLDAAPDAPTPDASETPDANDATATDSSTPTDSGATNDAATTPDANGGTSGSGGAASGSQAGDDGGCGCRIVERNSGWGFAAWALLLAGLAMSRRRRP